jgi:hypothetical protein
VTGSAQRPGGARAGRRGDRRPPPPGVGPRPAGHGTLVTYSPKVFIPLTKLCRDVCHYCTFAQAPRALHRAYLTPEEVLDIARAGAAAGCHEALFTLGDKPELRYAAARDALAELGHPTTISYLVAMARLVLEETGLLPHANPAWPVPRSCRALRDVSASQGHDARDGRGPALGAGRSAPRVARQAARRAPRHARGGGRRGRAVHDRPADRDRRDARRAHRHAARDPLRPRAARARRRGHRPELPRQARHADGRRAGARRRRPALDGGGRAARPRPPDERAGAAQPVERRLRRPARGRHRRLGRRLPRHGRPREPRGSVARHRRARGRDGLEGPDARAASGALPPPRRRPRPLVRAAGRRGRAGAGRRARTGAAAGLGRRRPVGHPARPRTCEAPGASADRSGRGRGARRRATRRGARRGRPRGPVPRPGRRPPTRLRRRRPAAARDLRRRGVLRRDAEHQLHERLLLPLRVLRLLQGQAGRRPPGHAVRRGGRRDRPPGPRGVGARRRRGLSPGRHPPGVHGRLLPRGARGGEGRRPRHPRPRLLGARGLAGRGDARPVPRGLPDAPARGRALVAARHRCRGARRRGAGGALPRQGLDRRSGSRCTTPPTVSASVPRRP